MRKFNLPLLSIMLFILTPFLLGQNNRLNLDVPMVDPAELTLDGVIDEAAWEGAREISVVSDTAFNIFANYYGREGLSEPEFDEYTVKLLWSQDTLYAAIHIDEIVNDSSDLFWDGQWLGDQLFVSLSNRLGIDLDDDSVIYDGNVYAAPDGPYHYLILGDQVTLNNGALTYVPTEYRGGCEVDSQIIFNAGDYARWGIVINETTGEWDLELAIYNPNIAAQSSIGFNVGGSQGSSTHDPDAGDAYMYYTWQPSDPTDPFGGNDPLGQGDPGAYNLNNSEYWAVLHFSTSPISNVRREDSPIGSPSQYTLAQNYPNPFNPTTTIKFQIPKQSLVTLKVYNIVGEEVATLVNNQVLGVGAYSAVLDASNLASGVYFYELRADNIVQTKKMVLLK